MLFGNKLRELRELKKYTQDYVATHLGMSQSAYSKIECNEVKPDVKKLSCLASFYQISIVELLSGNNENHKTCINDETLHHICLKETDLLNKQIENLQSENSHLRKENVRLMD